MSLTSAQKTAIRARGNVLVVAGAGTGKTSTLVERCIHCLVQEKPPASLEQILVVTFTDAAATEMRQRIRARLEQELGRDPNDPRWQEHLALFDRAQIGTLHGFCLRLVRQHFYELELDPQLTVMAEEEARLVINETLDRLLREHYAGEGRASQAVQELIQIHGRGGDEPIRRLILRVHDYTQTLADPAGWFETEHKNFSAPLPARWEGWLLQGIVEWKERWLEFLEEKGENQVAVRCVQIIKRLQAGSGRAEAASVLDEICAAGETIPQGKKKAWVDPLKGFLQEAAFLHSLCRVQENDPLAEDWQWVRGHMTTLLQLVREFGQAYGEAKREAGVVDFHDLEQYALRLLWDGKARQPTKTAEDWRERLRFILVDEYQDINAAQDKIIEAISRPGKKANRFLVGDVKQSIYRFRLADPRIFQDYVDNWRDGAGQALALVENFRSRERILEFVNSLFALLMHREMGGVEYGQEAHLQFGAPDERRALSAAARGEPAVELHIRLTKTSAEEIEPDEEDNGMAAELANLAEADKEARQLALRLRELKEQPLEVWDEKKGRFRPVEWRDMAVLLRAPAAKAESYAKEFGRLNVPLLVERGGFYQSLEITDLLSLLQMLDNPLQDVPVLAVLHSPLVGLTINELAAIRLSGKGQYWYALRRWNESAGAEKPETVSKVRTFLERFARWRRMARQVSLSRCLDTILAETYYTAWLLTQPRGEQRQANVQRLVGLAQRFDQFQRQGLFRFLNFIKAQQEVEAEPDVAAAMEEDAVRLMSIHQSKGLEFPVVAIADLGKRFNTSDLRGELILDEHFGLCPQVKPPHTGNRYPSLPHWLASRKHARELLGEELRLLYVGCTRARDRLLLSATVSEARFRKGWREQHTITTAKVMSARSFADWLALSFAPRFAEAADSASSGGDESVQWWLHDDQELFAAPELSTLEKPPVLEAPEDGKVWDRLEARLAWNYPFEAATQRPAKTSVTTLRRQVLADEQALSLDPVERAVATARRPVPGERGDAAMIGDAHHAFLELISLDRVGSVEELEQQKQELERSQAMTSEEASLLDLESVGAFWNSELGRHVLRNAEWVRRELVFTARFAAEELSGLTGQAGAVNEEFVIVQGVADLVLLRPAEIEVIDFKTDRRVEPHLALYEAQLKLYARALSRIYRRPVKQCWLYFLSARKAVEVKVA